MCHFNRDRVCSQKYAKYAIKYAKLEYAKYVILTTGKKYAEYALPTLLMIQV